MPDNVESAISDSLPDDVNALKSSISEEQKKSEQAESHPAAPADTTAKKVEQEPPFHEHPRWKQLMEEREYLRQQNQQLMEFAQKSQQIQSQPQRDPTIDMTPEEKAFWDKNRQFIRQEAESIVKPREELFQREIIELKQMNVALVAQNFFREHQDIKRGSIEESKIADLFRRGIDLDTAYETVTAPLKAKQEVETVRKQFQTKQTEKIKANVETSTVAEGIPRKDTRSFRQRLSDDLTKAGF